MSRPLVMAILFGLLAIGLWALPASAQDGTTPGDGHGTGAKVGGHIESSVQGSHGRVCVGGIPMPVCQAFSAQSGEMNIAVDEANVIMATVKVEFAVNGGFMTVAESSGAPCNRLMTAYPDVMTFCNNQETLGAPIDRFNLVIVQMGGNGEHKPPRKPGNGNGNDPRH